MPFALSITLALTLVISGGFAMLALLVCSYSYPITLIGIVSSMLAISVTKSYGYVFLTTLFSLYELPPVIKKVGS